MRCSPPTSANGIWIDDLVRANRALDEISSAGSAFVGRHHLCGNVTGAGQYSGVRIAFRSATNDFSVAFEKRCAAPIFNCSTADAHTG